MAYKVILDRLLGMCSYNGIKLWFWQRYRQPPTTVGAIASWANTTATEIQNTLTNVQASGAIEAQVYTARRSVVGT